MPLFLQPCVTLRRILSGLFLALSLTAITAHAVAPVEKHGALAVKGNRIVGKTGQPVSLAGPSLFWSNLNWQAERYYNADVVKYVREQWNASLIRAAMGVEDEGGYLSKPDHNFARVQAVVDAAIQHGLYVIVDWHSHKAEQHPDAAVEFFAEVATKYGGYANIIYEIYNEPLDNASWSKAIKPYAEKVIARIRAIDPDNLIVVGTRAWSQRVDEAAADPITGHSNIAYALHFYAGTHKQALRDTAQKALDAGIALVVTEWGSVNADGDGGVDKAEVRRWMDFLRNNHLSHCLWSLHDKDEGASILKPGTPAHGKWTDADLTEAGLFGKAIIRNWSKSLAVKAAAGPETD